MTKKSLILPLVAGSLLAGCQAAPIASPAAPAAPAAPAVQADTGSIQLTPSYRDGAVRRLMATLTPYTQASINHMEVRLFTVDGGGAETEKQNVDVSAANLAKTITFGNLKHNTNYRIRAYAYKAAGTAAGDKISDDGTSAVDLAVGTNNAPALGNLTVTLIDQTFSGEATSSGLTVNDGAIVHSGAETVTINP